MNIEIKFYNNSKYRKSALLTSISSIHYNYKSTLPGKKVSFESDLDDKVYSYEIKDVKSFEVNI